MRKWIPKPALHVLETLEKSGYEAYLVGGCVRDLLLGKEPADWDMTTSARPEQTLALFKGYAVGTGMQHGTVTVVLDGYHFEVTTYRVDGEYADHRHPDMVTFTKNLREDLKRRDFTINAMAIDRKGVLKDYFDGKEDLKRGVIRCVGEPSQRFAEDALRMMRAIRFSSVLGFSIEDATSDAIHAQASALADVAMERIRVELLKLLSGKNVVRVLLDYSDVLGVVLPEILPAVKCDQKNFHHCYDVWEHTARTVGYSKPEDVLRVTMLLHDLGKPACMTIDADGVGHFRGHANQSRKMGHDILRRLRFDNESTMRILKLVEWHDVPIEPSERALRRMMNKLGVQGTRDLLEVKRADNLAQAPEFLERQKQIDKLEQLLEAIVEKDACFSLKQLAVNGNDLIAMGYRGKEIGQMLQFLLEMVMDETLPNDKELLIAKVKEHREKH